MPCLAVWHPDLPHYRLLPKSKPQSLGVWQRCSVCRAGCTTDNNAASRALSHTHSCGPGGGGGLNLWSSAGFVYFSPTSIAPNYRLPPPFYQGLTYTSFPHTRNRTWRPSIPLRVRREIYVRKDMLVNGRVNANDVSPWFHQYEPCNIY